MAQPDFEIDNAEVQRVMRDIGNRIGPMMPKGFGFTLMVKSVLEDRYRHGGKMWRSAAVSK